MKNLHIIEKPLWCPDIILPIRVFRGHGKTTNDDPKWLIIRVGSGFFTVKKAALVYAVMERLVQHLVKMYRDNA